MPFFYILLRVSKEKLSRIEMYKISWIGSKCFIIIFFFPCRIDKFSCGATLHYDRYIEIIILLCFIVKLFKKLLEIAALCIYETLSFRR